jgi:hypothetical protein
MSSGETPPSWKRLSGCFGGGILVILLIIAGVGYIRGKVEDTKARIHTEWLDPYLQLIREGTPETSWETLTTEKYRSQYSAVKYAENFRKMSGRIGDLELVTIFSLHGGWEAGAGRTYQTVKTKWKWVDGTEFFRTFELVDVPEVGFRLDKARLGNLTPKEVPLDPW